MRPSIRSCRSMFRPIIRSPSIISARRHALALNMQREIERNGERYGLMKWARARLPAAHSSARHRHHAHAQSRAIGNRSDDRSPRRHCLGLPGHADRHRQPHADDQWPWRARLGRRGPRGRRRDVRPAGLAARSRCRRRRLAGGCRQVSPRPIWRSSVTERLRASDLAGTFVEFFGPGVSTLTAGERAVVANMAPEFGASTGYFPIDASRRRYLATTGRTAGQIALVEATPPRRLWFDPQRPRATPGSSNLTSPRL